MTSGEPPRTRLPRTDDDVASKEARRHHRIPADVPAILSSSALGRAKVTVTDLSQGGCRIRTTTRCHRGDHFVLRIEGTGAKAVTVIWHRDEEVGLAFAEPLCWTTIAAIVFGGPEPQIDQTEAEGLPDIPPAKVAFNPEACRSNR